ncbi:MAG: protein involved in polysaccharide export with SLBB domain [Gammaproteobacteria bacterium]|jgi:protein involved in polysaccharide export with SLBB domain
MNNLLNKLIRKINKLVKCQWGLPIIMVILISHTLAVSAQSTRTANQYELGSGDIVRIQVYNEEDLYLEARVSDTGTISYPFLGELKVIELTPTDLEELITTRLRGDYLIDPKVSVDIMEYRPFYVNGEVEDPGQFPFQPGITVRKAISVAGGFKERASQDKIFIIRDDSAEQTHDKAGLDEGVRPGDIITVEQSFF